jgi:DNA-binding NtrC family response regulator
VLQDKTFERVGGTRTLKVDTRIVAATNRDLRRDVASGRFREDLYFRLAVVTVSIPPLREREADLPALAEHFLEKFRRELARERLRFSDAALAAIRAHRWPGNVRELENAIERAAILTDADAIEPLHLALDGGRRGGEADGTGWEALATALDATGGLDRISERARDRVERVLIERALSDAAGNKTRAAEILEVNYKRLLARIKELGIE